MKLKKPSKIDGFLSFTPPRPPLWGAGGFYRFFYNLTLCMTKLRVLVLSFHDFTDISNTRLLLVFLFFPPLCKFDYFFYFWKYSSNFLYHKIEKKKPQCRRPHPPQRLSRQFSKFIPMILNKIFHEEPMYLGPMTGLCNYIQL